MGGCRSGAALAPDARRLLGLLRLGDPLNLRCFGGHREAQFGGGSEARTAGVAVDCVLLKPCTTVGDLVEACKRASPPLLSGDFVRAEGRAARPADEQAAKGLVEETPQSFCIYLDYFSTQQAPDGRRFCLFSIHFRVLF